MAFHNGPNSLGLPLSKEIQQQHENEVTVAQRVCDQVTTSTILPQAVPHSVQAVIINSVFSTYRGTTTPLSPFDAAVVNSFKAQCTEEIGRLVEEKAHIQSKIFDLCSELGALCLTLKQKKDQLDDARSLQVPIRCVPPEILNKIFEMCLPSDRKMNSRVAPLLLCQVSRQWREVATRNPMLWDSVSVDVPKNLNERSLEACSQFFSMVLERSRGMPITFEIRHSRTPAYPQSIHLSSLLDSYSQLFPQCRDLDVWSPSPGWLHCLAELVPTARTFASLNHLSLAIKHRIYRDFTLFKITPKLNALKLDVQGSGNISKIVLPCSQLEKVNYQVSLGDQDSVNQAFAEWRHFLRRCENLRQFEATFNSGRHLAFDDTADFPTVSSTFDNLTSLYFGFQLSGSIDMILKYLRMPSLKDFGIRAIESVCRISLSTIQPPPRSTMSFDFSNLLPSFHSLQSLSLLSVSIPDADIFPMFLLMPLLRSLSFLNFNLGGPPHLRRIPEDTTLVRELTRKTSDLLREPLLPNLVRLELSYPYHRDKHPAAMDSYILMVQARCELNAKNNVIDFDDQHTHFHLTMNFSQDIIPDLDVALIVSNLQVINTDDYHAHFEHRLVDDLYEYAV
ncbi:hypothetical protein GALMADRAFT_265133 [Galerina marginata CBS 339.88]|uniref:Uncharacterized protein n=1 Tax=Galerina marginata (strain CBS 339.88) TaxID=685588 RepID=A0A067T9M9_GALM3|nr:hypothetical protein GALMADRAFT_265133 [Galerina marginata CBS 339.88]